MASPRVTTLPYRGGPPGYTELPAYRGQPLNVTDLIRSRAPAFNVDPRAALAVAGTEGLSGRVGDRGTSFGPFQLHVGGAYPSWAPQDPAAAQQWASSPAGVDYALSRIGKVAGGLTGRQAIESIVRRFERPAAPDAEISRALQGLGGVPATGAPLGAVPSGGAPSLGGDPIAMALISSLGKSPAALNEALMGAMASSASSPYGGAPAPGAGLGPVGGGMVSFAKGADRAGVSTNPAVVDFIGQIAGLAGRPLTIGTGTNHNEFVKGTSRQSAHWVGNAADISASGDQLTQLGQDALIAAGMPPETARQQKGGLFNIGGYQVIFNSNEGGNHFNHLHVGLRGDHHG